MGPFHVTATTREPGEASLHSPEPLVVGETLRIGWLANVAPAAAQRVAECRVL